MIYVLSMLPLPFQFSNLHDNTNPETALPRFLDPRCAQVHSYPSRLPSRNLATPRTPNCSGKVFRMTELTCVHKQPVLPCATTEVDSAILMEIDSKCGWSSTTSTHRDIQRAYSRNNPFLNIHNTIMKFFASISSFLLLLTLAIAVNAATDAEKACGFVKKVGTPCTIKLDGSKTITGTCQRKCWGRGFNGCFGVFKPRFVTGYELYFNKFWGLSHLPGNVFMVWTDFSKASPVSWCQRDYADCSSVRSVRKP
ncbi:hypothetical protein EV361DRAFT_1032716 [Lentinula raphanica]|nr:hypothetical protein EV361DRAFT_1032716 [Lentinula raphanica]